MVSALFDTNVIIDFFRGYEPARQELHRFERRLISVVTRMEVLVGSSPESDGPVRRFLATFEAVPLDEEVIEAAITLRRERRIKLPDAIVWASARTRSAILVSRNTKDFPADDPGVRVPYFLS